MSDSPERRAAKTQAMRDFRIRNLAKGLCPQCGKQPCRAGNQQCQVCVDRKREHRHANPKPKAMRLCGCGKELAKRQRKCQDCLIKQPQAAAGLKLCPRCGKGKHLNAFPNDKRRPDGKFSYCKMCHRAYQSAWNTANPEQSAARQSRALDKAKAWKEQNPEAYKEIVRRGALLRRYGITPEQYGQMLEEQGGHCALCDRTPDMETHGVLAVDHDHACCGKKKACGNCVRCLLCFRHNLMLGAAQDSPDVLRAAASLLETWVANK